MYYAYILKCNDETLYVGSTNDLKKRLYQHNNLKSAAHYTKIRRPVALVYSEEYENIKSARAREVELKRFSRKEKLELIEKSTQLVKNN
jgi:putative endonuclease